MVVLILESVPSSLRGELSRWMIEPRAGVFVGSLSGMVRDKLWEAIKKSVNDGGATMLHNSNTEQGFAIRTHGRRRREVVDFEGLKLVCIPIAEEEAEAGAVPRRRTAGSRLSI